MEKIKCPKTITGMINALSIRYPAKYISIEKVYDMHQIKDKQIDIGYTIYIGSNPVIIMRYLTWPALKIKVAAILKKEG